MEEATGVTVFRHSTKKPGCGIDVLNYFRDRPEIGIEYPGQIAVIGDRLFTDVMMANMIGAWSIWVKDGVLKNDGAVSRHMYCHLKSVPDEPPVCAIGKRVAECFDSAGFQGFNTKRGLMGQWGSFGDTSERYKSTRSVIRSYMVSLETSLSTPGFYLITYMSSNDSQVLRIGSEKSRLVGKLEL